MLKTYYGNQNARLYQAPPTTALMQAEVAFGSFVIAASPSSLPALALHSVVEDGWMPQDDAGPLGAARNRRSRPADAAVLGALVSGPVGAEAVAVPWAVGVGATGTLARPTNNRRAAAAAGAHDCRGHAQLGPGGLPAFVDAEGDGWRLSYRTNSGIPWSLGHWPYLPRWGFGGQVAYYSADVSTVCAEVPPMLARGVARRLDSWWWPYAYRLGLARGPWALPLPKDEPRKPLAWLAPGDCAELSHCHHELLSLGLVFSWLRVGPQWTNQRGSVLRLDRLDDGRLDVVLEQITSKRTMPVVVDLPILASLSVDAHEQSVRRRRWIFDVTAAVGSLGYQLVLDHHLRQTLPQALNAEDDVAGSLHEAVSSGQAVTAYLPWTLLRDEVRGLGASRASGVATVRHGSHGAIHSSLWVEGEVESVSAGHDAYRIGMHASDPLSQDASPERVAVGLRLHVEKLSGQRRQALFAQLSAALDLRGRTGRAAWDQEALQDVRIHLQYVVPTQALFAAQRTSFDEAFAAGTGALNTNPAQVAQVGRALAEGLLGLGLGGDVVARDRLEGVLRDAGPGTMMLIGRWLADANSCRLQISYGETEQLLAQARVQAALRPNMRHVRAEHAPRPLWNEARVLGLRAQLLQHEQALAQDALFSLMPQSAQARARRAVLLARARLA